MAAGPLAMATGQYGCKFIPCSGPLRMKNKNRKTAGLKKAGNKRIIEHNDRLIYFGDTF